MIKHIFFGVVLTWLIVAPVSALTMTQIDDLRFITAEATAGGDFDFNIDFPAPVFSPYLSAVSAQAIGFNTPGLVTGNAAQESRIDPLAIFSDGSATASGNHSEDFRALAASVMEVFFSIDEAAEFSLVGFLSAGTELALGLDQNGVNNMAGILLINTDTNETAFEREISDSSVRLNESGVIGPGNYRYAVHASAEVFGNPFALQGDEDSLNSEGYATSAGYEANLELRSIAVPIPEPVTTSLVGLSLGAMALQTSRRHRSNPPQ